MSATRLGPFTPGLEGGGVIDAVGPNVPGWEPGLRVGVGWNGGYTSILRGTVRAGSAQLLFRAFCVVSKLAAARREILIERVRQLEPIRRLPKTAPRRKAGRAGLPLQQRRDHLILEQIGLGVDMVVNLACGLDTRPLRMNLPSHLQWIEVDLPGILDYKEALLGSEKKPAVVVSGASESAASARLASPSQIVAQCAIAASSTATCTSW